MANNLRVTITAVDRATATVRRINNSMSQAVSPVRSLQRLGSEIARNPAIDGLKRMGGAAGRVASMVGKITGPMAGLTGLGTIAGLAELTAQWARLGQSIGNTTASLGVTTRGLTTMRGAARMAGVSAETMDGGLEALRQSLQDARWHGNTALLGLMKRTNVQFKYTKDGAFDLIETMKDVADAMAAQPTVGAKHTVAQGFGLDGLYPLLIKGRQAIEDYQKQIEDAGGAPTDAQIKKTTEYAQAIERLSTAADSVGRGIADRLQTATLPIIDWAAKFAGEKHDGLSSFLYGAITHPMPSMWGGWIADALTDNGPGSKRSGGGRIRSIAMPNAGMPLGIRSNNPLNLMPRGREAVFPTVEDGLRAAMRNLMGPNYFGSGNDTVAGIINRWSPANAPGNSAVKTAAYISAVQGVVGTGHLNPGDPAQMASLLSAMTRQENGAGSYDASRMDEVIKHVVIEFKNAPVGVTASARSANGNSLPVRVVTAMPATGVS